MAELHGLISAASTLQGSIGTTGTITGSVASSGTVTGSTGVIAFDGYTIVLTKPTATTYRMTATKGTDVKTLTWSDGAKGDTGNTGNGIASAVLNADYTLTLTFTDGTTYTTPSIRGEQGLQGVQGNPGRDGNDGRDGSDAEVTAQNIAAALGYTPLQTETDPTVPDWAKAQNKPTYQATEIVMGDSTVGVEISDLIEAVAQKQDALTSADKAEIAAAVDPIAVQSTEPSANQKVWIDTGDDVTTKYVLTSEDVDATLTDATKVAQSKAVGDKIDELSEDIAEMQNTGGTATNGQVWTANADGAGWADAQGGGGSSVDNWELIETITLTGDTTTIERQAELDGTQYRFKKILVTIANSVALAAGGTALLYFRPLRSTGLGGTVYNAVIAPVKYSTTMIDNSTTMNFAESYGDNYHYTTSCTIIKRVTMLTNPVDKGLPIGYIKLYMPSGYPLKSGAKIEIYAVRA